MRQLFRLPCLPTVLCERNGWHTIITSSTKIACRKTNLYIFKRDAGDIPQLQTAAETLLFEETMAHVCPPSLECQISDRALPAPGVLEISSHPCCMLMN